MTACGQRLRAWLVFHQGLLQASGVPLLLRTRSSEHPPSAVPDWMVWITSWVRVTIPKVRLRRAVLTSTPFVMEEEA